MASKDKNVVELKVVLLGKVCCGKTSLAERYLRGVYFNHKKYQATIGAAYGAKRIEFKNGVVVLGLWDTAGSERYESMSRLYYRGSKAAIICYDVTDKNSFDRAVDWGKEVSELEEGCLIYFCGTKKDILKENKNKRQVDYNHVIDVADDIGAKVFETSSKDNENIDELFDQIISDLTADISFKLKSDSFVLLNEQTDNNNCYCNI